MEGSNFRAYHNCKGFPCPPKLPVHVYTYHILTQVILVPDLPTVQFLIPCGGERAGLFYHVNNVSVDLGGGGGGGGRGHDQKNKLEAISCVCAGVSSIHEAKSRTKNPCTKCVLSDKLEDMK